MRRPRANERARPRAKGAKTRASESRPRAFGLLGDEAVGRKGAAVGP
jgi:hypothetical protein